MDRAERRRQMRLGNGGSKPRRFPIATVMLLLIVMISVISKCQSKNDKVQAVQEEVTIERAITPVFTSTPRWSGKVEEVLRTKCGDVRVFNPSNWEIDIAFFEEIMDRECSSEFVRKLELRVFDQPYVVRTNDIGGFGLTNVEGAGTELGLTVTHPKLAVSVIPTGWAVDGTYLEDDDCTVGAIRGNPESLLTVIAVHELVGHGILRAQRVERTPQEECEVQEFEVKVHRELDGRAGFRRK